MNFSLRNGLFSSTLNGAITGVIIFFIANILNYAIFLGFMPIGIGNFIYPILSPTSSPQYIPFWFMIIDPFVYVLIGILTSFIVKKFSLKDYLGVIIFLVILVSLFFSIYYINEIVYTRTHETIDGCNSLYAPGHPGRDICLAGIARKTGNPDVCDSDRCFIELATKNYAQSKIPFNSDLCNRINNTEDRIYCYSVHHEITDIQICLNLSRTNLRRDCVTSVAVSSLNESVCNQLNDTTSYRNCANAVINRING